jgi:hypothetical protein
MDLLFINTYLKVRKVLAPSLIVPPLYIVINHTMWFLRVLILALLQLTAFAAKKSSQPTFEGFHEKFLASAPLRLDDQSYDTLTTVPRDYGVAVLLTALEARFGCVLCRDFQPEWDILSRSWARGDKKGSTRMLFGTLDFTDGKATFQKVRFLVKLLSELVVLTYACSSCCKQPLYY